MMKNLCCNFGNQCGTMDTSKIVQYRAPFLGKTKKNKATVTDIDMEFYPQNGTLGNQWHCGIDAMAENINKIIMRVE